MRALRAKRHTSASSAPLRANFSLTKACAALA